MQKEYNAMANKLMPENMKYIKGSKSVGEQVTRVRRTNTVMSHQLIRSMAKKYGWDYTRRRTR